MDKETNAALPETFAESLARWHRGEEDALRLKAEDLQTKALAASEKAQSWADMGYKQKVKKCLGRMRSTFTKPYRIFHKLRLIGDDIEAGVSEGIKMYRIDRLVEQYSKQKMKLDDAVQTARQLAEEYPDISEEVGGFDWTEVIPPPRDEDGRLTVVTSEGQKTSVPSESGDSAD